MKTQRDQLLDILASGLAFKCQIILDFDVRQERLDAETVPADAYKETQRMLATSRALIEEQDKKIDQLNYKLDGSLLTPDVSAPTGITKEKPEPIPEPKVVTPDKPEVKEPPKRKRKLSKDEVWAIRRYLKAGHRNTDIARRINCTQNVVWRVKAGRSYKNVPSEPHPSTTNIHAGHGVVKQK